jgi:hypothetical protein
MEKLLGKIKTLTWLFNWRINRANRIERSKVAVDGAGRHGKVVGNGGL